MNEKITMYQITRELLLQNNEENISPESALIKEENSKHCKQFKKVVNNLAIDEEIFKEGNQYLFQKESVESVKELIRNNVAYTKLMSQSPEKREINLLGTLTQTISAILRNELKDSLALQLQLSKLELVTFNQRKQLNTYLQSLSVPDLSNTISEIDNEILHMYYIEEMLLLKEKMKNIHSTFSDIRNSEIADKSIEEIENNKFSEGTVQSNKIKLDKLLVRELLAPKKKKDNIVEQVINRLVEQTNLSEKEVLKQLKDFKNKGFTNHNLFELSQADNFMNDNSYMSPFDVLEQAKTIYEENKDRKRMGKTLTNEQKEVIQGILSKIK